MLRTLALVLACVLAAAPAAHAKKRPTHARAKHAAHKAKPKGKASHQTALAKVQELPRPRVAAAVEHPAPPPEVSAPRAEPRVETSAPAPSPPVTHGPMGPQEADDKVPGSKMKR